MASVRTTWIVLPQRATESKLRVVVAPSPRLEPDGKLGDFETWRAWPATLAGLSFSLDIKGLEPIAAQRAEGAEEPDAELWERLFGADIPVRGYAKPQQPAMVHSFPALAVSDLVHTIFAEVAKEAPDRPPMLSQLKAGMLKPLVEMALVDDRPEAAGEQLAQSLRLRQAKLWEIGTDIKLDDAPQVELPHELSAKTAAFLEARTHLKHLIPPKAEQPEKPPPVEKLDPDFHQAVSLLSGHPTLMRRLGLAVELELELPESLPADGLVRLVAEGLPDTPVCPWTRFHREGKRFVAAPKDDGTVAEGMLTMANERLFRVERLDVDGAGVKLIEAVDELRKKPTFTKFLGLVPPVEQDEEDDDDDEAPLPGLRSAGFSIIRDTRVEEMIRRVSRVLELEEQLDPKTPDQDTELDADDTVRGYRLDVWDAGSGKWRSLHRRRVTYRLGSADPILVEEEGYIKPAAAKSGGDLDKPELFAHEVLFGWDGWSLSAPRPGRVIGAPGEPEREGEVGTPEQVEMPKAEPMEGFGLTTEVSAAPGTLPRLRYGQTYRFRARAVDLASGGLELDEADDEHATAEHRYVRYEGVQPPAVVRRWLDTEAESIDRVVVRSDVGANPDEYSKRAEVKAALEGVPHEYRATGQRHLAAPKVSQWMAELHGVFDGAFGPDGDPDRFWKIAIREAGTLIDAGVDDEGNPIEADDVVLSEPKGKLPDQRLPKASRLEPGQYFARTGEQIPLPYLPDPLARGVSITGLPGWDRKTPFEFEWKGEWPDRKPIRLVVTGGEGGPEARDDHILVHLPPGELAVLQVSSLLDADARKLMALDELTGDAATPDWMLTPTRELRLVHAVQRPLVPPKFTRLAPGPRALGDTHVDLEGSVGLDAKSTGRVEVVGTWTDPIDVPGTPDVENVTTSAVPAAYDLGRRDDEFEIRLPNIPQLSPLLRMNKDEITAVLRNRPPEVHRLVAHHLGDREPVAAALREVGMAAEVLERAKPKLAVEATREARRVIPLPTRQLTKLRRRREALHEFSDTKHRFVKYVPRGTTRYREYFPPAIGRDLAQITSPPHEDFAKPEVGVEVNVLSTARPLAPVVRAVVPIFTWETKEETETVTERTRHGGGLRVLLERPWFSSGVGEQLAVVLPPPGGAAIPAIKFSAWGADPVWKAGGPPGQPLAAKHFPRAIEPRDGIAPAEAPKGPGVTVAPHAVTLDKGRGVWVCDMELGMGASYLPFVRLTLARFQPDSVDGAHLSRVVVSEFAQLVPERRCRVKHEGGVAEIEVHGPSGANVLGDDGIAMQAIVELQPTELKGDIGWVPASAPVPLAASGGASDRTWSGRVELPSGPDGLRRRLRVAEHEWFPCDDDVGERSIDGQWAASRLVYTDAFSI